MMGCGPWVPASVQGLGPGLGSGLRKHDQTHADPLTRACPQGPSSGIWGRLLGPMGLLRGPSGSKVGVCSE